MAYSEVNVPCGDGVSIAFRLSIGISQTLEAKMGQILHDGSQSPFGCL